MAKRLMDEARDAFRIHHYSHRTEEQYLKWMRRYILFHGERHPQEMGADEIQAFLNDLANVGKVSASTQNQALSTLLFLYKNVLRIESPYPGNIMRAKSPLDSG